MSATFGLALAFALSSAPASAIETQPAAPAVLSGFTKVSERCMHWDHRCHELYPAGGWRFRRCMALHGCR
ncbi:MAG: hypothetical protein ACLPWS_17760 [Rhodomicrobium sp.]